MKNFISPKGCLLFLLIFLALQACAPKPSQELLSVKQNSKALIPSTLTAWSINGSVGARLPGNTQTASFYWFQSDNQHYDIILQGPFALGKIRILQSLQEKKLEINGKIYKNINIEQKLQEEAGIKIPVKYLPYWIKATPYPQGTKKLTYDANGNLQRLSQAGWQINYLRYQSPNAIFPFSLPTLISLKKGNIFLKIYIKNWRP